MKRKKINLQEKCQERAERNVVGPWFRQCLMLGIIAAILGNIIDALLIQRKFNFFTGGFLSVFHLKGPSDTLIFIVTSLIADIGVTLPLVAITLVLCYYIRLNLKASQIAALIASAGPIIVADFISYRILEYVGDVFEYQLAVEISGRSFSELVTVASVHLIAPIFCMLGAAGILFFIIWKANGYCFVPLPRSPAIRRLGLLCCIASLVGLLVTCAASMASETLDYGLRHKLSARIFYSVGDTLTDFDKDGYGMLQRPRDPDPFNSKVFPYATDSPGNGIDEDGVAGDLPLEPVAHSGDSIGVANWKSHPNVILIVLETFRADLVGMMYRGKAVTPVLNELARRGISVDLAFVNTAYTAPSRYHLFSGKMLPEKEQKTLIDDFKANGYEVAYFSAQDESFGGKSFDIGFDRADIPYDARVEPHRRYTTFTSAGSIALPYDVIIEKVAAFLASRNNKRPLFMYVNFQDAHFPYHHSGIRPILNRTALSRSKISPDRADDLWSTYANTAANVDYAVGKVLDAVGSYLGDPKPGIIVTADHGESLYDDGFLGHGFSLNDIQTRIPLVIVDLPITVEQPFEIPQMRAALNRMLSKGIETRPLPVVVTNPEGTVFLYVGNLERPAQIALRGFNGITVYDFRSNRVQISGRSWRKPEELTDTEFTSLQALVNLWERMIISHYMPKKEG